MIALRIKEGDMEKKDKKDKRMFLSTGKLILASLTLSFVMILLTYGAVVGMRQKHLEQQADTTLFETMRLADFEGGTYTSEQLKNSKLTVINIWETTCSACLSEMPDLQVVYQNLDPNEVQLIGMCADVVEKDGTVKEDYLAEAKDLLEQAGCTFPQLIPDETAFTFIRSFVSGFPATVFLDSNGKIIGSMAGSRSAEEWLELIGTYLDSVS